MRKKVAMSGKRTVSSLIGLALISAVTITACKKDDPAPPGGTSTPMTKVVYVADEESGTVSVIDAELGVRVKTIDLMDGSNMFMPHNVQVAPDGQTVWVTGVPQIEGDDEQVIIIRTSNNEITSRISMGSEQHLAHVVLDDASDYAYVTANETNQVIKINARTYTEVTRFDLDTAHKPHGLRYSNGKLFVACMDAKSMAIIDVNTGVINDVPFGGVTVQTAVTSDGVYAFGSQYDTKEVVQYNVQNQQITHIALPSGSQGPIQMYPTPDNNFLYICDQGVLDSMPSSNKVYVYDIAAGTITNTITVGNAAHGVVINNDGTKAFITNSGDNTVSVIDIATNTVVSTIPVGDAPNGISYWYSINGVPAGMH